MPAFAATGTVAASAGGAAVAAGAVSPISVRSTSCTLTPAAPASCCPPSTFTLPPPPSRFIVTSALPSVFFFTFLLPLSAVLSALFNEAASCVAFCLTYEVNEHAVCMPRRACVLAEESAPCFACSFFFDDGGLNLSLVSTW